MHDTRQIGEFEPFFKDETGRKIKRPRAHHRHVIDRAMHRQATDVSAGKEQRRDNVRVGGHDQLAPAWIRQQRAIVALRQVLVTKVFGEQFLDQLRHCPATRAMSHVDMAVLDVEGSDVVFAGFGHRCVFYTNSVFRAWGADVLSSCFAKEEGDPESVPATPVPCAARSWQGLRNSGFALRQSSPFSRQPLRCSAPFKGAGETIRS